MAKVKIKTLNQLSVANWHAVRASASLSVDLVVTGGSLTRKTEKVTLLYPGRSTLTNEWAFTTRQMNRILFI